MTLPRPPQVFLQARLIVLAEVRGVRAIIRPHADKAWCGMRALIRELNLDMTDLTHR